MKFTFDPAKNRLNLRKHRIDLVDVEGVFFDPMALTCEDRDHDEERFVTLSMDGFGRLLIVAYTYRGVTRSGCSRPARPSRMNDAPTKRAGQ